MNCTPVAIPSPSSPKNKNPAAVVNPLCIILVKNGSKGDRLLFRYPYSKKFKSNSNNGRRLIRPDHQNEEDSKNESFTSSSGGAGERSSGTESTSSPGAPYSASDTSKTAGISPSEKTESSSVSVFSSTNNIDDGSTATATTEPAAGSSKSPLGLLSPTALKSPLPTFIGTTTKPMFDTPLSQISSKSFTSPPVGTGVGATNVTPEFGLGGMTRMRKVSRTTAPVISRGDGENLYSVSKNPNDDIFSEPGLAGSTADGRKFSLDGSEMLCQLSDKDLSNLLAVNSELAERKFELKLNFVRFVGHPTLMHNPRDVRPINPEFQTSVKIFHIVFCLNAAASHSIVKCFFDLSKRLGIGLRHEEYRCGFLNQEMRKIIATHDEACTAAENLEDKDYSDNVQEKVFDDILAKSKLAQLLKRIYDDVCHTGYTFTRINNWVQVSFCLPHRVHVLPFRKHAALVEPETIHRCLEAIRPYHAILLLVDPESLISSFWIDCSSTIPRLLQVYSPLKSLQTLAADADLTLSQVVEIASHLVYWAHATVIYPLCESNVYFLAADTPMDNPELDTAFKKQFPSLSMLQVFSDFSLAIPLGERMNPMLGGAYIQSQLVELVTWMLQRRLLIQLHTYLYMATYLDVGTGSDQPLDQINVNVDPDISLNLNIRPFDFPEEDDATASDTLSETMGEELALPSPLSIPQPHEGNEEKSLGSNDKDESSPKSSKSGSQKDRAVQNNNNEEMIEPLDKFKSSLPELNNETVKRALGLVNKSSISLQDIKMFSKLAKYFNGEFHVEEIMYRENVRRSQLMLLLDKFRECLITVEKEDADISFLRSCDSSH